MPTLGAHSGESESGVMLLGNWKSPAMARDYVAYALAIPLNMARRLVAALRHGWLPNYEGALAVTGSQPVRPVGPLARHNKKTQARQTCIFIAIGAL